MLVLTRRQGQQIQVGRDITITLVRVDGGGAAKIGIAAPRSVPVVRTELLDCDGPESPCSPGTRVVNETSITRQLDGIAVTERVLEWNETGRISVDYEAGDVPLWADPESQTSFDSPLDDNELRQLLADYRLRISGAVTIRFIPQAWVDGWAIPVDPAGPTAFLVPIADAQDADGKWLPDRDDGSDPLREHPNAPEWIRGWPGPFEIEIESGGARDCRPPEYSHLGDGSGTIGATG